MDAKRLHEIHNELCKLHTEIHEYMQTLAIADPQWPRLHNVNRLLSVTADLVAVEAAMAREGK
jgi:hypothetical protein